MKTSLQNQLCRIVALSLLVSLCAVAAPSRAEILEQVAAIVGEDPVFLSEVRTRALPFLARAARLPTELDRMTAMRSIYHEVLERLIDEKLFSQAATTDQISVTASDVDAAVQNVQSQAGISGHDFWDAIREQGITEAQYRTDIRAQLLRYKVLNARSRGRVNVTEDDVRARYDVTVARSRRAATFSAAYILIPVEEGASATAMETARQQALEVATRISDADSFEEEMRVVGGGELSAVRQGELETPLEEMLLSLEVGAVGAPVRGANGYFIFLLRDRRSQDGATESYDASRNHLYQEMLQEAMQRQETALVAEMRRQAVIERRLTL